jgi:hypothetical protein
MERSAIRVSAPAHIRVGGRAFPDCASLHPGYRALRLKILGVWVPAFAGTTVDVYRSIPSNTGKLTSAASAISA